MPKGWVTKPKTKSDRSSDSSPPMFGAVKLCVRRRHRSCGLFSPTGRIFHFSVTILVLFVSFSLLCTCGARADASRKAGERVGPHYLYMESVYSTLCSWRHRTSQILNSSQSKATVDAHGYVICRHPMPIPSEQFFPWKSCTCWYGKDCIYTYQRGLLRCSFRLLWAMREPRGVGRVTGTDSHVFSYPHVTICKHAESGEFIGDKTYKQLWKSIL